MNRISILELHRTIQEKKQKHNEAFEKVLGMCHKRIKAAAEMQKLQTFIVIPEFVVGYPIYNLNECLDFVINALKKNGFLLRYYFPKILYVSWDLDEIETDKQYKQKPMSTTAMLPKIEFEKPKALLTSNIAPKKKKS